MSDRSDSWSKVPLGELLTRITYGFTNPMPTTTDGPYMLTAKDIRGGRIDFDSARRTSWNAYRDLLTDKSRPRRGDVLLTKDGSIGRVAVCGRSDVCINQSVALLQLKEHVSPRFLAYLLQAPVYQAHMEADADGSTIKHIYITRVDKMRVAVPGIHEQEAIANVLGALDDKIAINEKASATSRDLSKARFTQSVKDGTEVRVSDVVEMLSRGVTPSYRDHDGMLVLNQKCVRNQRVTLEPARSMAPLTTRLDRILLPDDVLVNSTGAGTLGRAARWTHEMHATVDSHITIVRFDARVVDPVCAGFGLLRLESQIESLAEGSTGQTELRRDLLGSLTLRLPSRSSQASLGEELNRHDALERSIESESRSLAHVRDELLPLLISGKIRVKDAEAVVLKVD